MAPPAAGTETSALDTAKSVASLLSPGSVDRSQASEPRKSIKPPSPPRSHASPSGTPSSPGSGLPRPHPTSALTTDSSYAMVVEEAVEIEPDTVEGGRELGRALVDANRLRSAPPPRPHRPSGRPPPSESPKPRAATNPIGSERPSGRYSTTSEPERISYPAPLSIDTAHSTAGFGSGRISSMPPGLDSSELSAEERVQRLKMMVSRLLKDLRQREQELAAALERKAQLRNQLQAATERLAQLGAASVSEAPRESGDFGDAQIVALRRRVKALESALGVAEIPHPGPANAGELANLKEQNELLLKRNAELELRVAELKAKTTFRDRFLRDIETSSSPPPSPAVEFHSGALDTPAGSPSGAKDE